MSFALATAGALPLVTASRLGERALAALRRSGGRIDQVPEYARSGLPYARAGAELVWVGCAPRTEHPRMVVLESVAPNESFFVAYDRATVWPAPVRVRLSGSVVAAHLAVLMPQLIAARSGAVAGFAAALWRQPLRFPLDRAHARLRTLAQALRAGDPQSITQASIALLGVGPGLTPSGDDLVGGMLFAYALCDPRRDWHAAVTADILAAGERRTHPLSVTLLGDLATGRAYGALHACLSVLAEPLSDTSATTLIAALDRLGALGHCSGWDLFAGLALAVLQPVYPLEV